MTISVTGLVLYTYSTVNNSIYSELQQKLSKLTHCENKTKQRGCWSPLRSASTHSFEQGRSDDAAGDCTLAFHFEDEELTGRHSLQSDDNQILAQYSVISSGRETSWAEDKIYVTGRKRTCPIVGQ